MNGVCTGRLLLLFVFLFTVNGSQAGPAVVSVNRQTKTILFEQGLYLFRDTTRLATLRQVIAQPGYLPIASPVPIEGDTPHWIRFTVRNLDNQSVSMLLEVGYSYFNEVKAYVVDNEQLVAASPTFHWSTPFLNRPFPHRYFVIPLTFAPERVSTVYLLLRKEPGMHRLPLRLWQPAAFTVHSQSDDAFWGGITGWLLFAIVWGVYLFVSKHGILYGFYSVYVFAHLGALIASEGLWGDLYLSGQLGLVGIHVGNLFIGLIVGCNLLFLRSLLNSGQYAPYWLNRLSSVILLVWAVWLAGYFVEYTLSKIILPSDVLWKWLQWGLHQAKYIITPPIFAVVLAYLYLGIRHTSYRRLTLIYLLAFFPIIIASNTFFFSNFFDVNHIGLAFVSMHMYALTVVFETAVLMFGLAYRFKTYRDERERLLKEQNRLALQAQQEERQRLARELHNNVGPDLAVLKLRMEKDKADSPILSAYIADVERIMADVRQVSHILLPEPIDETGLIASIERFVKQLPLLPDESEVNFTHSLTSPLSNHISQLVFQITKELINNALKHAEATIIDVELYQHKGSLQLTVADNGRGYNPTLFNKHSSGIGLRSIRTDVERINGRLETTPKIPSGVTHRVILPSL